jgi:hypothetical protein
LGLLRFRKQDALFASPPAKMKWLDTVFCKLYDTGRLLIALKEWRGRTMTVFDHMPMGEEGLKEIYSWVDNFVRDNSNIADKIVLGKSEDGKWDVPAVVVTNKSIPDAEKQIAIVTLARHGQERGARVVGPEILHYLAGNDAGGIRDRQKVVVVPIVNPIGVILDKFHSTLYGITDHEKRIFGNLCSSYVPDMMIDYHSLGKSDATRYDRGDMEVIIPANSSRWGMDEPIYQYVAGKMMEAAAAKGWPYEIHTLEDLNFYYFGDPDTGRLPQRYLQEKVFLLHIQNLYEHYDFPPKKAGYTNYTNGPAYAKWHTLVFGVETNHWSIKVEDGLAESGAVPCQALLNMGNNRFPWEKDPGYPTNILVGDFRISIRPSGRNPGERRASREKIWNERFNFDVLRREMLDDPEVTLAEVGYLGESVPLAFDLCLRMRQKTIKKVLVGERETPFETFKDDCSTFVSIPVSLEKAGKLKIKVFHEAYRRHS